MRETATSVPNFTPESNPDHETVIGLSNLAWQTSAAINRINFLQELENHRHHLESLVRERAAEIGKANEKLLREIVERKQIENELRQALEQIKTLKGIVPICSNCKRIRDDSGYCNQIEAYIREHSDAEFSHGICPECARKLYPEMHK